MIAPYRILSGLHIVLLYTLPAINLELAHPGAIWAHWKEASAHRLDLPGEWTPDPTVVSHRSPVPCIDGVIFQKALQLLQIPEPHKLGIFGF